MTSYFKGYWMVTNRCNLKCSYCVLENSPQQKKLELDLDSKKQLITHLYEKLNFRRLTLSGGEVSIIGKQPPSDFLELLSHIRQYRSSDKQDHLEIEMYTNGIYLTENVIDHMTGVVDLVAMTIDSQDSSILNAIGRTTKKIQSYYDHVVFVSQLLKHRNIAFKLHSVISQKNHLALADEVAMIARAFEQAGGTIQSWKFFQYMSYDVSEKDNAHFISEDQYDNFKAKTTDQLAEFNLKLHYKDNKEMNASLFNILSYGNAQYMRDNDSWSTSKRTRDLRTYQSMEELFSEHDINESRFRQFHEIHR